MRRVPIIFFYLIFAFNLCCFSKPTYAATSCSSAGITVALVPSSIYSGQTSSLSVNVVGRMPEYTIKFTCQNGVLGCNQYASYTQKVENNKTVVITDSIAIKLGTIEAGPGSGNRFITVYSADGSTELCQHSYHINRAAEARPTCTMNLEVETASVNKRCLDLQSNAVVVSSNNVMLGQQKINDLIAELHIDNNIQPFALSIRDGSFTRTLTADKFSLGSHTIKLITKGGVACTANITKVEACRENEITIKTPTTRPPGTKIQIKANMCLNDKGVETALGCIPFEPLPFIGWVLRWGIGIGGGIAFLIMAFAAFQLMTSAGNPEKLKGGQEMFVSAGAGLLFIIFSVFLLQLIGADILQIPGFGR